MVAVAHLREPVLTVCEVRGGGGGGEGEEGMGGVIPMLFSLFSFPRYSHSFIPCYFHYFHPHATFTRFIPTIFSLRTYALGVLEGVDPISMLQCFQ